jgi:steroid delta-isomerase-like uncharacterized protein
VLDARSLEEGGDRAVLEWTYRGTHTGDIPGLAASGRDISLPGVGLYRLRDGLFEEERVYWDAATLYGLMD